MHRYRPYSSASKATPTTRCQKCLKLGTSRGSCALRRLSAALCISAFANLPTNRPLQLRMQSHDTRAPVHPSAVAYAATIQSQAAAETHRSRAARGPDQTEGRSRHHPKGERGRAESQASAGWVCASASETRRRLPLTESRSASPPPRRSRSESVSSYSSYSSISSGRSRSPTPEPRSRTHGRGDRRRSDSHSRSRSPDHERSVRRKFRDSPSPGTRGRRLSPTDNSRRTRSVSPPRRIRSPKRRRPSPSPRRDEYATGGARRGAHASRRVSSPPPPPPPPQAAPPRERSLSPFTRRRLMTEAMQRGG
jgi:hypothetical protein